MRILMISDVYFPRINGVSTSIQTFAYELTEKGHEVTLIAPSYGDDTTEPFEIIRIPARKLPLDPEDRLMRRKTITHLIPELRTKGFDLLHIQTPFVAHYAGVQLAKALNIPTFESYHTFFEEYLDKYIPLIPRSWLRFAARRFSSSQCNSIDRLIVPSQAMLDVLHGYGVQTNAHVIPTGIKPEQFTVADGPAFRTKLGIPANRPALVHVGRIAHEKNIDFLLNTLVRIKQQIPDILLIIAGEGPARPHLEKLAQALDLTDNTIFVGYLDRNGELQSCYAAGDLFIFASRTETQGLVLLEAMALGVPVVSTAVMGTKEVLHDGEGAIIAEEHELDFADKVVQVLSNQHWKNALAAKARPYAQQWLSAVMAERLIEVYAQAVECT
ncbi:MAG: glycosyltransferase [Chromatiales bacterium]|nr:glycosyltransferase [Chromatiales bacterium]